MGMGIARSLAGAGIETWGFDVSEAAVAAFAGAGGQQGPAQALDALIVVVVNAAQMDTALFGATGHLAKLAPGGLVLACPTIGPDAAKALAARVEAAGYLYLDAPISGGSAKAATGALTVMASGSPAAMAAARSFLDAMAETVFALGDTVGPASAMKIVNQLLAGVHIASTAEAMTFALSLGIPPAETLRVISACAGTSWMFENRGPHIVDGDYTPHSAVDIFVKDLGLVAETAGRARFAAPLAATALQQFLAAAGQGLGREDDAAVAKVYARNAGLDLP
jgi:3-hydroxyisobutyrate dehydrogenase-like beta-hydroxyacid dehydrogenase